MGYLPETPQFPSVSNSANSFLAMRTARHDIPNGRFLLTLMPIQKSRMEHNGREKAMRAAIWGTERGDMPH